MHLPEPQVRHRPLRRLHQEPVVQLRDPRGPAHAHRDGQVGVGHVTRDTVEIFYLKLYQMLQGLYTGGGEGAVHSEAEHQSVFPAEDTNLPPVARRQEETGTLLDETETISARVQTILRSSPSQEESAT